MKLYELKDAYKNLLEVMESEEFKENSDVAAALDSIEDDLKSKLNNIGFILKDKEADITARKNEIERLTNANKVDSNTIERLKNYMRVTLAELAGDGAYKVETALFKFSLSKPRYDRLEIDGNFNLDTLPAEYKTVKVVENKKAIKDALKAGEHIDGAFLAETRTFSIK